MRLELLWNPGLAIERLAYWARQRRRLRTLHGTVAQGLAVGHIESLELLAVAKPLGIRSIYDIGAHVGTWALLAKAVIPEAAVEAFEPLAKHCTEFGKALQGVGGVRLHAIALGSENGSALLRVTDCSDASSLLPPAAAGRTQFDISEVEQIRVELRRLDDFRAEFGLAFPDLIKLDVQGYEMEVLKGAAECLAHAKAIVIEVSVVEYYEGQCLFHDLVDWLARSGFFLAVLGDHTPTGVVLAQADMLFLRRR